jgi:hypothetical protein
MQWLLPPRCVLRVVALVLFIAGVVVQPGQTSASVQRAPLLESSYSAGTHPPALAFYYMWYHPATFTLDKMSDLPVTRYSSSLPSTIDRQITEAAGAGITGFITSYGCGGQEHFPTLMARSAALAPKLGRKFTSTIYVESDGLGTTAAIANAIRAVLTTYGGSPYFFHYQGKPLIFIWDPLGQGRTLADWAAIRQQVDPNHRSLWSAEGVSTSLLDVFDGIHLFSASYWALLDGTITASNAAFRAKVDAYNAAHGTHKLWAAGVEPGYNDSRIRAGHIVPRANGATYRTSWTAALASKPDLITITSFNEWFEGAMIEPSIHYGDLYLKITQAFTRG